MKVLIVAGGTGGHLYPGVSIAKILQEQNNEVLLVIRDQQWEKEVAGHYQIPFRTIAGTGLKKTVTGLARFILNFWRGFRQARIMIREYRPDIILALGNYLSLPVGLAGRRYRVPLILHEQNCLPGKAIRMLSSYASVICTSFAETGTSKRRCRIIATR